MKIISINKPAKLDEEGYILTNDEIRYIIVDEITSEVLDDAQGYGYRSEEKALAAYRYKYGGGREKIEEYEVYWKQNIEIANFISLFIDKNVDAFIDKDYNMYTVQKAVFNEFGLKIPIRLLNRFELAYAKPKKKKKKKK